MTTFDAAGSVWFAVAVLAARRDNVSTEPAVNEGGGGGEGVNTSPARLTANEGGVKKKKDGKPACNCAKKKQAQAAFDFYTPQPGLGFLASHSESWAYNL
jgi:hypothetical protein